MSPVFHEVLELLNVLMLIKINLIHFSVHLLLNAVKLLVWSRGDTTDYILCVPV